MSQFNKCATSVDGYFSYCRPCNKETSAKYKEIRKKTGPTKQVTEKKCSVCKQIKQVEGNFWTTTHSKDGYKSNCNLCYYEQRRKLKEAKQ
jgi:hypothetical protein